METTRKLKRLSAAERGCWNCLHQGDRDECCGCEMEEGDFQHWVESKESIEERMWKIVEDLEAQLRELREVRGRGCACSDDEACAFVRERETERKRAEQLEARLYEADKALEAIALKVIAETLDERLTPAAVEAAVKARLEDLERQVGRPKAEQPRAGVCPCGRPGRERIDNGLAAGVHCDECWYTMLRECRSRSW